MNKRFATFLTIGLLFTTAGCNKEVPNASLPVERMEGLTESYADIDATQLNLMLAQGQSFILTTYSSTCLCSLDFYDKIWNPLITEYSILSYKISETEFAKFTSFNFIASTPEIVIFKEGQVYHHLSAYEKWGNDESKKSEIVSYLSKYIYLNSPLINITTEKLDQKIANHETFVVYFKYNVCKDCNMFSKFFLNKYLTDSANKNITIYAIESAPYRANDTWQSVKDKYGLSASTSSFGYLTGVVPTIQLYKNGVLNDAAVIYNDELTKNENNKYVVSSSYYEEFVGTVVSGSSTYHAETYQFYKSKFISLMDKYKSL